MKKLLIIAYYFLPSQASGVFRTLAFTRYLASTGWEVTVLTVEPGKPWDRQKVTSQLPERVTVVRARERDLFFLWNLIKRNQTTHIPTNRKSADRANPPASSRSIKTGWLYACKDQITGLLKVPDSQAGWFFPALLKGRSLARPDVIYCSGPPFTCHLVGIFLKRKWDVPLVIDYRDPWEGNPFRVSRGGIVEKWDRFLENTVIRSSDHILLNTRPMKKMYARHFPGAKEKMSVITNGFDPDEFKDIQPERSCSEAKLLFVHPGVLYGRRNPLPFLRAVHTAVHDNKLTDIHIQFIGSFEQFEGKPLQTHIRELHLDDHVTLYPPMDHAKVLSVMKGADLLLLLALGTTLQVPAKLFEYMGIGKPIFAVCEEGSATQEIMNTMGAGHYSTHNREEEILAMLTSAYAGWRADKKGFCHVDFHPAHAYIRQNLAGRLLVLLEDLVHGSGVSS